MNTKNSSNEQKNKDTYVFLNEICLKIFRFLFTTKKGIFLWFIVAMISIPETLGSWKFFSVDKIDFLISCGILTFPVSAWFITALITTWKRDWLRVASFIFFLSIFIASCGSKLNFSLVEAVIISAGMTVLPLLITFLFHKKERKERLKEKGYRHRGYLADGVEVLSDDDLHIIHIDKNCKIIESSDLNWHD